MTNKKLIKPSAKKRWNRVLGGFMSQGKPCKTFCREKGIIYNNAREAVLGLRNGEESLKVKAILLKASKSIASIEEEKPTSNCDVSLPHSPVCS